MLWACRQGSLWCWHAMRGHFIAALYRFIKMSSPNMNNLIIAGSILTYASVVLLGIDTRMANEVTYNVLCTVSSASPVFESPHPAIPCFPQAKVGVLSVGFSLAFGSMFSKTWRVHSIFTNIKLNKKVRSQIRHNHVTHSVSRWFRF